MRICVRRKSSANRKLSGFNGGISPVKSASVYRWSEVAIAIAASARVAAHSETVPGQKSACGKSHQIANEKRAAANGGFRKGACLWSLR
jgi:hypothetical protein